MANALEQIDSEWEKSEAAQAVIPKLEALLEHEDYWVRHTAAGALNRIRTGTDVPPQFDESSANYG